MFIRKIIVFIVFLNLIFVGLSFADGFVDELFAPVQITETGKSIRQYPPLSKTEKTNLLNAKKALVDFLKCFGSRDCEPMLYLSDDLKSKYADRYYLYRKEFGGEAILRIEIFDFLVKNQNTIEIIFYTALTETSEGVDVTTQLAFELMLSGNQWKLSRFNRTIKFREIEQRIEIKK